MFNQNMARDVDALKLGKRNVIPSNLPEVVKGVCISLPPLFQIWDVRGYNNKY